ncbi:MAG: T9SS C-terminal target domain-containing protein [Haliscomenobacteraceae bacterium CHB4]|nr:hypothetical protein [Saprospiraceae bacterium]MCE7924910.1 T9SS C-terminal target domain-containing protein [Haliscomenobacteraceae bacterium CHB4]
MKPLLNLLFVLLAVSGFGQTTIDSGIVAFLPFCGDAIDHSGTNNNGTVYGGLTFVEDRLGNPNSAAYFDGINDFVQIPNSISLDTLTDSLTLACWFYTKGYDQIYASLLSKSIHTPALRQYSIIYDKYGVISFGHTKAANQVLALNQWYHIAITCKDSIVKCYLDGNLIDTNFLSKKIEQTDFPLDIGRDPHIAIEFHYGMIDDVRVYNRALSSEEVSEVSSANFDCSTIASNEPLKYRDIKLYPNPTEGILTIESKDISHDLLIEMHDILGKLVQKEKLENNNRTISLKGLNPGIYYLKIETDEGSVKRKIIKM